ncbi:MAG: FAD-dependent oxidoreductase [Rhizobiaceae bacterium]|nr:FAD-dependent oxidoreductase [Rhizobiaceae bacterium]
MNIVVVGGGRFRRSTAGALVKRGAGVSQLEQGAIPNPLAASGDHHRIIRRAYRANTGYGRLMSEAYDAWGELWGDLGRSHIDPRGFICVSLEDGDQADLYREGLEAGGYPFETFGPAEAARRYAFLEPELLRYVLFSRDGGALHCKRIAEDMAAWLRANGANIYENSRVASIDPDAGRVTLDTGETLSGDRVVVTAGAWVTKLFSRLVLDLTTYRTAVVYLDPPPELRQAWADAPVILKVGGPAQGYIVPPTGGGGLKFGTDRHKVQTSDADWNRDPVEGEGEAIRDLFAPPIAQLARHRVAQVVTCAYTFTQDEHFFASEEGRCLVVSPCSGHGYKFGASVGRRVADAVETGDTARLQTWLRAELP